ncbi:hypothetical protein [Priestia taiwanensis]|uniref:Uncharacterized protein n=1 Tax=Priestia taiwanensis TaxID=1347902 RepID=A0A917EPJ8_9BACI|nr:hypothetical protein [Priestia taiwanensis]MBM7364115.1 hypothetical protein [Priestia taiwanensis]GGE71696.1 hypothetical protein GCM10007140_22080 [Priestia taiwanensis]
MMKSGYEKHAFIQSVRPLQKPQSYLTKKGNCGCSKPKKVGPKKEGQM